MLTGEEKTHRAIKDIDEVTTRYQMKHAGTIRKQNSKAKLIAFRSRGDISQGEYNS